MSWIKLHRSIIDWEWYSDRNVRDTFIHMLLRANHEDKNWKGVQVKRGQFVSSNGKISKEIGVSNQQLRTSLSKLQLTGELTRSQHGKATVFTIINYDLYQSINKETTRKPTSNQQGSNKEVTTTKEVKKLRSKEVRGLFVKPEILEIKKYFMKKGLNGRAETEASKFFNHYESKGWLVGKAKMKDWEAAARNWIGRMKEFNNEKSNDKSNHDKLISDIRSNY